MVFLESFSPALLWHVAEVNLVVHKGYQRQGIGTLLLKELIEAARGAGLRRLELWVRASNLGAIALYQKAGFVEEGRLRGRVKVGSEYRDDLVMALWIKEEK